MMYPKRTDSSSDHMGCLGDPAHEAKQPSAMGSGEMDSPDWDWSKLEAEEASKGNLIQGDQDQPGYQVGKRIGQGAFGVVYEGVDLSSGRPVAIKFVSCLQSKRVFIAIFCADLDGRRNLFIPLYRSFEMSIGLVRSSRGVVCVRWVC